MFSLNLLSITIWVLGGILFIFAIVAIFWRILKRKNINQDFSNKNIGSISKQFNDFIISLRSSTDFDIMHNILIKNKFSKNNYSIIPAIIFSKGNAFLLTNAISSRKYNQVEFNENEKNPKWIKNDKRIIINNLSKTWTQEIIKYLNHKFSEINFNVVIPIIDDSIIIKNKWKNYYYFKAIEFEDQIIHFKENESLLSDDIKRISRHFKSVNLFKNGISLDQKNIRKEKW